MNSRILIVDDDANLLDSYKQLLFKEGYELLFASEGNQGLAMAEQHKPDLILLDVMMPDMSGFELCQRIRHTTILAEVPILMITALDDHESTIKGIESGADDYIVKPFNQSEICARIRTITRLNRYRRILNEQIRFQWIIQHANNGYLIDNSDDEIIFCNHVARQLLELPGKADSPIKESFIRKAEKIYKLKPPEAWYEWQQSFNPSAERFLIRPETENSESLWLKADVMKTDSQSPEFLICLKDITSGIVETRSSWDIQEHINHKIRTSLNALSASLKLVNEDLDISENEKKELLMMAHKKTMQIQNELLDILLYKNVLQILKTGEEALNAESFPELVKSITSTLEIAPVQFRYDNACLVKGVIKLTYQSVRIIIREILENSKKFHPLQAPHVEIRISCPDNGYIVIQIADDGINLSPIQLSKIWTPFYQCERYFTGSIPGMGLGLSVVASIILESGGDFRAYHREDKPGTVIELSLPFEQNQENV